SLNGAITGGTVTVTNLLTGAVSSGTVSAGALTGNVSGGSVTVTNLLTGNVTAGTVSAGSMTGDVSSSVTVSGLLTGAITAGTNALGSLSSSSVTGGTNTISGAATITTVDGGTTSIGDVATITTLTSGTVTLTGATAAIGALNGGMVALGTTALTVSSGTFAGVLSGVTGSLTKSDSGTLTLSGANPFGGGTTLSAGTVRVGHADAFGAGFLTLDGGTLTSDGTTARAFANEVTFGGAVTFGAATTFTGALTFDGTVGLGAVTRTLTVNSDVTFAGIVSAGGLIKEGAGALTLSGDNTFSAGTTLSAGTVRAGHADAFGGGALILNAGRLTSDGATARAFANNVTIGGDLALGAATTFTGALTFGGAVDLGAAARTLTVDSAVTFAGGVTSTDQNLTIGGAGDVTISTLSLNLGLGSLTMNGTGTLLLSVANTFAGATINNGTIKIGHNGSLGSGTVNVGASGTLDLNNQTISNTIVLANGAVLTGGTFTASSLPTTTGTLDVVLEGAGVTLAKADTGRLELTGENTYTGATSVTGGGTIAIADFGNGTDASPLGITSLSDPTKLVLSSGSTLEFNGGTSAVTTRSFTIGGSAGIAATGAGTLEFTSASQLATTGEAPALTLTANNAGTNRFAASLVDGNTGVANLAINGTGIWVIGTGANRFKNDVRIEAAAGATIGLENASLPSGATLAVANNATIRWEAGNATGVKLEIAAGTAAKLNLGSNNVVFSIAPVVASGSGTTANFEKQGSGTLTIANGVSAPSVNVTLPANSGLLSVNGTIGDVTLASGSRLGGSGAVGTVTLGTGAFFAPGNSPGTFFADSFEASGGSTIEWEVQDATSPTGYDKLNLTGNFDLTGANPGNKAIFKVISRLGAGDGNTSGNPFNFGPPNGSSSIRTFNFAVVGGVLLNSGQNISDVFQFDLTQFTYSDGSASNAALWSIAWDGGSAITLTAVPEPSTYGFGLGALALAAAAIRRRKRQAKA
ncbi:MAG: beta strand repeat-containing protein, partial [Verrucomicrobiota bacterium]